MKKIVLSMAIICNIYLPIVISMVEKIENFHGFVNLSVSVNSLVNLHNQHIEPKKPVMDLSKIFPDNLRDIAEVAVQLKYFVDILFQNNINLSSPLVIPYVEKLANFAQKNQLFSTALSLGFTETIPLFTRANAQIIVLNPNYISKTSISESSMRLFIAEDIPINLDNVQNYIKQKMDSLFHRNIFEKEKHGHITMLFIGDTDSTNINKLIREVSFILGKFVKDHPMLEKNKGISNLYTEIKKEIFGIKKKVIVLDVKDIDNTGSNLLNNLNAILRFYLKNIIPNPILSFLPHITLGTIKQSQLNQSETKDIMETISKVNSPVGSRGPRTIPPETFVINRITLYKSEYSGSPTPIASWLLSDPLAAVKF